ncbi:MAG: acetylornithine transaminase [Ignavibacteria bacterium]|nr:acetylornithine transaminase [Ignavibacteria bacterium]
MFELIDVEKNCFVQVYKRFPFVVSRAEGARIYDTNGNSYLDFLSGLAVNILGHSHPIVIAAIEKQAKRYLHLSNFFYQDIQILYAEKILKIARYDKIFFVNTGAEGIENALKAVRLWGNKRKKKNVIAFGNSFHGRTYGCLSLMNKPLYKNGMEPFLPNITILPFNDIESLVNHIDEQVAGIFLESILGEGGLDTISQKFADTLMDLKEKYDFLIVADEIQSGLFRTGSFFAFDHFGIKPDIVALAKGLGGGLPLGAVLFSERFSDFFNKGTLGTTFGGNPLSCAAGFATLDFIHPNLLPHINYISSYLDGKLKELQSKFSDSIVSLKGLGLMRGISLKFDASILVDKLFEQKIISNATSSNVLRILPPFIINKAEVDEFIEGIKNALENI